MRRLGWLIARAETDPLEQAGRTVLREGLAKLGWIEGRNLRIEVRFAADNLNRLHTHAAELINLVPDVIVSSSAVATRSLQQRTKNVPIVFVGGGDPAAVGLVQNIVRPEGNTTGFPGPEPSIASATGFPTLLPNRSAQRCTPDDVKLTTSPLTVVKPAA